MTTTTTGAQPDAQALKLIKKLIDLYTIAPEKIQYDSTKVGYSLYDMRILADATDYGKVLGKEQAHLQAFKAICKILSDRNRIDLQLHLEELPGGTKKTFGKLLDSDIAKNWDKEKITREFQEIFDVLLDYDCVVKITDSARQLSAVEVLCSESERRQKLEWLELKLGPVIKAIGMANKRIFSFGFIPNDEILQGELGPHTPRH